MSRSMRFAPLVIFLGIVAALVWRLASPIDTTVPSKLVGQALPDVRLGSIAPYAPPPPLKSLIHGPTVVNFFASWCVPCVAEAPVLAELQHRGASIVGIAVRDAPDDIARFLRVNGNPYRAVGTDPQSAVQMALGSSGVPETFIVDGAGIVRYQHIGPVEADDLPDLMRRLEAAR